MFKKVYKSIVSEPIRNELHRILFFFPNFIRHFIDPRRKWNLRRENLRNQCIYYFKKYGNEEQKGLISFLKKKGSFDFPYEWTKKYNGCGISVFREDGFPYVIRNGKKLFGKKSMSDDEWKGTYNQILLEQDEKSPHRYMFVSRLPEKESVFADIGVAEGFLALDVIDIVEKVYLFECNPEWIDALKMTFRPYRNKVEIINKYVSDIDSDTTVKLDNFFKDKRIDYIKADIEGFEEKMLTGASNIFSSKIKKCLLCCYHRNSAESFFKNFLQQSGFNKIEVNKGYIIWTWAEEVIGEPLEPPFTRHGVMYAEKL